MVAGAVVLVLAGFGVCSWHYPYLWDLLRGGNVDHQCRGRMTIQGSVGSETLRERHCQSGFQIDRSTFIDPQGQLARSQRLSTEVGSRGRLIVSGTTTVLLAWVRRPGPAERWYCARSGTIAVEKPSRGQVTLTGVRPLAVSTVDPAGGTLDWSAGAGSGPPAVRLTGLATAAPRPGSAPARAESNPEWNRASILLPGGPGQSFEVFLVSRRSLRSKAKPVAVQSAFVLVRDDRWPLPRLAVARPSAGSTARMQDDRLHEVHLRGLSAPVACPAEGSPSGSLKIAWSE